MCHLQVNGVQYHIRVQGSGPPLVLLHGFTGSSGNWAALTAVFAPTYHTITIDLLGHGRTDSPPDPNRYAMEQIAEDIVAILQRQKSEGSNQKANLLGYSMGGRLALYIALHYPDVVQSLILESASPGLETEAERTERRRRDEALADKIEREGIRPFVNYWESLPLWHSQQSLPNGARQALRQQRLQNNPRGLANSLRGMGTGAQPSLWEHLGELQMPVLLLAGELDGKFVGIGKKMAAKMPAAQLEIVPGVGHTVHLEKMSLFHELALKFLRGKGLGSS